MGVENLQSINSMRLSLAAPWAQSGPAWVLFGCVALAVLAIVFYSRWQPAGHPRMRGVARRLAGDLVGAAAADAGRSGVEDGFHQPAAAAAVGVVRRHREHGYSRRNDRLGPREARRGRRVERPELAPATSRSPGETLAKSATKLSRMDYVKAVINRSGEENIFARLEKDFRIEPYILDRPDSVRELSKAEAPRRHDRSAVLVETTDDQRPAHRHRQRVRRSGPAHATSNLAGVVMFSDFGNNNGPAPAARPLRRSSDWACRSMRSASARRRPSIWPPNWKCPGN